MNEKLSSPPTVIPTTTMIVRVDEKAIAKADAQRAEKAKKITDREDSQKTEAPSEQAADALTKKDEE